MLAFGQAVAGHEGAAGLGFHCSCWNLFRRHEISQVSTSSSTLASEILPGPLVEAIECLLQVFQRIGHAEAQVAFAEFAERRAGKRGYSGLLKESIG